MGRRVVLVVDDDAADAKLLGDLLAPGGYRVLVASEAESGIAMARAEKPDCIIMDIHLPGMDGIAATRALKADAILRTIPVVALTGVSGKDHEQAAIEAGCDGYLTKPIDPRGFLDYIDRFLHDTPRGIGVAQAGRAPTRTARVLVVDDDPAVLKMLERALGREGFQSILASSADEALRSADAELPDVILLDVLMPGMDGFAATRRLKGNLRTMHTPIILITALNDVESRVRGLEAGADEFLSKPLHTAELMVRIRSMTRLAEYREQLSQRRITEERAGEMQLEEQPLREPPRARTLLVALVDDADAASLTASLAELAAPVRRVREVEDVEREIARGDIALVILDGGDAAALDLCRRLKESDDSRTIQIALTASGDDPAFRILAIEAGADELLAWPMDPRELCARARNLVRKKEDVDGLRARYRAALAAATRDGLTTLHNKSSFRRFLELEVKRSRRQGHPTGLLLLDLDDFKKQNDTLGHLAGDHILSELGGLIRGGIRDIDFAARYGGEEFGVVLPYTGSHGAVVVAERLREAIRSHQFLRDGPWAEVSVTASMGVAFCPTNAATPDELIREADAMLYEAKRSGKDRICICPA